MGWADLLSAADVVDTMTEGVTCGGSKLSFVLFSGHLFDDVFERMFADFVDGF
jgi:hypothetical protein